jgi:hypothetical protein
MGKKETVKIVLEGTFDSSKENFKREVIKIKLKSKLVKKLFKKLKK